MSAPSEAQGPPLGEDARDHLHRLMANWSLLSDLSFSDLLLVAPADGAETTAPTLEVLGQIRPNNRTTLLVEDLVATVQPVSRWPEALAAMRSGEIVTSGALSGEGAVTAVPVGHAGTAIAAVLRLAGPLRGPTSPFEPRYLDVFDRLCAMVAESTFPFPNADVAGAGLPRLGDGLLVLDASGRCEFATPNAVSALHRLGAFRAPEGLLLDEIGVHAATVDRALASCHPAVEELDAPPDVSVVVHVVPLAAAGVLTGAVVLVRDVTDLRELGRLVVSKDAALREVHHRVKNNLQTISSLLRLQARRSDSERSRQALFEAERRVRAIALVHEILSKDATDQVPFDAIVDSLVAVAEDAVLTSDPVEVTVSGSLGALPADVATPLAVVLSELLMNAVEHGFVVTRAGRMRGAVGHVSVRLSSVGGVVAVEVRDNGAGLPEGFDLEDTTSLGLSIVR
ncbi:MAG TPA: histidine kinase N-terminal domain-containing protein, partial [Acidimicrobiales bacterium]